MPQIVEVPAAIVDPALRSDPATAAVFIETPRTAAGVLAERRDLVTIAFEPNVEFTFDGFHGLDGSASPISAEELQRRLHSNEFLQELDRARDKLREEFDLDRSVSITVAGVSLGVSVAYVLWLVRGGVLMGSYLSALPAWRLLDPLPVLSHMDDEDDEEDDVLGKERARRGDALRGFS
ncbi:MAG TPA: hypothetical protein VHA82_06785 [Ramlibacter sp.]|nr:hypothetical protein [Ramlibacter sp.]